MLCNAGTPLLAVQAGVVHLASDPLGGTTVQLERPDGSFWYYAHLDAYAPGIHDGARVGPGTILGRCGSSGDASVPHLHFCLFTSDGTAVDPMPRLVRWLRFAERRIGANASPQQHPAIDTTSAEDVTPHLERPSTTSTLTVGVKGMRAPAPPSDSTLLIEAALIPFALVIHRLRRRIIARRR